MGESALCSEKVSAKRAVTIASSRAVLSVFALRNEFWVAPVEALLDRATTAAGLGRSIAWMELVATRGGGPSFLKFGRRVLYRKGDVLSWLERNSIPATSTSNYPTASQKATEASA